MTVKILFLFLLSLFLSQPAWATDWCADSDCQGCWLMDVDEDPIRDSSQNSYTGAINGSVTFIASAKFNGGYSFAGNADYFGFGSVDESEGDVFSVVAYVYNDNTTKDHHVLGNFNGNGFNFWFDDSAFVSGRTNTYSFYIKEKTAAGGATARIEGATNAGTSGSWQHVAVTFVANSATGLRLYVGGVEDANSPVNVSAIDNLGSWDADNLQAGESPDGGFDRLGDLDELAVFDTAVLDGTDINSIMINGLQPAVAAGRSRRFF